MAKNTAPAGEGGAAVGEVLSRPNNRRDTERNGDWQDPQIVFLQRASTRLYLVERGEMDATDAIMGLAPSFYELVHPACDCTRDICERMEKNYPPTKRKSTRRAA